MSPLWRDEIGIYVSPRRVVLSRMKRGLRPLNLAESNRPVANEETHQWEATLDALESCLEETTWHGAIGRLIVADHWARYAIVPWSDALTDQDERLQHARYVLAKTYGDVVSQWAVTLNESARHRPGGMCDPERTARKDSRLDGGARAACEVRAAAARLPHSTVGAAPCRRQAAGSSPWRRNRWQRRISPAAAGIAFIRCASAAIGKPNSNACRRSGDWRGPARSKAWCMSMRQNGCASGRMTPATILNGLMTSLPTHWRRRDLRY